MRYIDMYTMPSKVALITGGAQGIGADICVALSEAGCTTIVSDLNEELGHTVVESIRKEGGKAFFHKLDVSSEEAWTDIIAYIDKEFGRLDILVNNAGIMLPSKTEGLTLESFQLQQKVNVEGVFLGCKAAISLLAKKSTSKDRSSIINMSSMAGLFGSSGLLAYCATKGAVRLMSKSLAAELGKDNIRVNSVHPGLIDTQMGEDVHKLVQKKGKISSIDEAKKMSKMSVPLKSLGDTSDVASAILFLASCASNYITGTELVVDGGLSGCK
jgi:3alpha(or 20beta)-hydroxysteroid dehydrogenase